jgi:hypothetical protein
MHLRFRFSFDAAGLATGVAPGVILCVADGAQDATPRVRCWNKFLQPAGRGRGRGGRGNGSGYF